MRPEGIDFEFLFLGRSIWGSALIIIGLRSCGAMKQQNLILFENFEAPENLDLLGKLDLRLMIFILLRMIPLQLREEYLFTKSIKLSGSYKDID